MSNESTSTTALAVTTPAWTAGIYGQLEAAKPVAEMLAKSELVPKQFQGKPNDILIAGAMGARLGLDLFSALAGIAVVNGRATLWGDAMLAVCQNHPEWGDMEIGRAGEGDQFSVVVTIHRKGHKPCTQQFSMADAKHAGLLGSQSRQASPTWSAYPKRMVENRAKAFALRTAFADALAGFHAREEIEEDVVDVSASVTVHSEPKAAKKRTVDVKTEPLAAATEPTKPIDAFDVEPVKSVGEHLAEAQATEPTPPRDTSVDACVKEYSKLWNHSDAARDEAKKIREAWKLKQIADLAGAGPDDREAFLIEVETAMKRDGK